MKAILLTDKAVRAIISALRSTAKLRTTAKDRDYMQALVVRMLGYQHMHILEREPLFRKKRERLEKRARPPLPQTKSKVRKARS